MLPITVLLPNGETLADKAWATENTFERAQGWLGKKVSVPGEGLLISPCSSVHTFGMGLTIDVAFLDRQGKVLALRPSVRPQRLAWSSLATTFRPWAVSALELPDGTLVAKGLQVGQVLSIAQREEKA